MTPEEVALALWHTINGGTTVSRVKLRRIIRDSKDPAVFSLAVGLALGVVLNSPVRGYHEVRKLLTEKDPAKPIMAGIKQRRK